MENEIGKSKNMLKKLMPYWIYLVSVLIVCILAVFEPLMIFLTLAELPALLPIMIIIVYIVGASVQKSMGKNARVERILLSLTGGFLIAAIVPVSFLICRHSVSLFFHVFRDKTVWVIFGAHGLVLYLAQEITYLLNRKNYEEEGALSSGTGGTSEKGKYVLPLAGAGIVVLLIALLSFGIKYRTEYMEHEIMESFSVDGKYQVIVYQIGDPTWPFGKTDCRIVLKMEDRKIQEYDFTVFNDGGNVNRNNFEIEWDSDCVNVTAMGEEQADEGIRIFFSGEIERESLTERNGKEEDVRGEASEENVAENEPDTGDSFENSYAESEEIYNGYRAIYEALFQEEDYDFISGCDAKGHSRYLLKEDNEIVEFLVFDRNSKNGACELYAYYRCEKASDSSWSPADAKLLDIYAYEMKSGDVISSGKTTWSMSGCKEYYEITGEY